MVTDLMQDGIDGEPLARRPQSSAAYVHLRSSSPGLLFVCVSAMKISAG